MLPKKLACVTLKVVTPVTAPATVAVAEGPISSFIASCIVVSGFTNCIATPAESVCGILTSTLVTGDPTAGVLETTKTLLVTPAPIKP